MGSSGGGTNNSCKPHRQASIPGPGTQSFPPGTDAAPLEILEYPFLTMKTYPPGFILHIGTVIKQLYCCLVTEIFAFPYCRYTGGTVCARSVKLLDRINSSSEEPETRDNWWTEIRMEVRSHARALGCTVILGYEEHTSIW